MSNNDFQSIRTELIKKTKSQLADSVTEDIIIMQTLATIDDLSLSLNNVATRLREWAAYTVPELEHSVSNHESFARFLVTKSYDEILSEFVKGQTMGARLSSEDYSALVSFATKVLEMYELRTSLTDYLESSLQKYTPNTLAICGPTIAARLLSSAGSLRRLATIPASTIQLYGAEKALFRHLRSGAKSPKYGHIFSHPLLQNAARSEAGKVARALADKIAMCAKLDYFKGDFLGDKYLIALEVKFGGKK
ncbi:hypothetical protein JXA48_03855 [Candidatus Woesearchaeota archaeon]|nr:hypothetical protein [Candidatus Woesearchaeota archaeon]